MEERVRGFKVESLHSPVTNYQWDQLSPNPAGVVKARQIVDPVPHRRTITKSVATKNIPENFVTLRFVGMTSTVLAWDNTDGQLF